MEALTGHRHEPGGFPRLPRAAAEIICAAGARSFTADELELIVLRDSTLDLERLIVHFARSCHAARRSEVNGLRDAIRILGGLSVCHFIAVTGIGSLYHGSDAFVRDLWDHSLATGILAHMISRRVHYPDTESAFMAGILHDIGKLAIFMHKPDEYRRMSSLARHRRLRLHEIEGQQETLPDHAVFGAQVALAWGCPASHVNAILNHHNLESAPAGDSADETIGCIVATANLLAHRRGVNCLDASLAGICGKYCARRIGWVAENNLTGMGPLALLCPPRHSPPGAEPGRFGVFSRLRTASE